MAMKYLILQTQDGETPVIFPEFMYHDQMEEALEHDGVIAAGFIKLDKGKLVCFGESSGLGIKSRQEDDVLLVQYRLLSGG